MNANVSEKLKCGHCHNIAPMYIIGHVPSITSYSENNGSHLYDEGYNYYILNCPACEEVNVVRQFYHSFMTDEEPNPYEVLYPISNRQPIGLPSDIQKLYEAALKIKTIDAQIYAITLRKILELVCQAKKAKGRSLADKIKDLSQRGEIPVNLVKVANGLKEFGNIGAHEGVGSLSNNEIPLAEALCNAILEYVYTAPHLAERAEKQLNVLKGTNGERKIPKFSDLKLNDGK